MKVTHAKTSGKKQWCLDLGIVDGKRQREFFSSEAIANAAMKVREKVALTRGRDSLAMPTSDRVRYQEFDKWCSTHNANFEKLKTCWLEHAYLPSQKETSEAIADFIKVKSASGKRPAYVGKLRSNLQSFAKKVTRTKVNEVTSEQIEGWARNGAKSLATVRSRLVDVQTLYNFCVRKKWCLKNPVHEIEKIQLEDKPPGIHTVEEVKALLQCALDNDRSILGYIVCCYFGGLRPAESKTLTREQIHDDVIEVTGPKAKTRRRRFIPINATLKAWLAVDGIEFGMTKRSRSLDNLRWILSGKKLVPKKNKPKQVERVVTGFPWPHDVLRHSFCSYGLPKFGARDIAAWAGHSEQILFAHYRERVRPAEAEAFWAIRP